MKKILIQLDPDEHASVFDTIVAYDSGVDVVLPFNKVNNDSAREIVYGAIFTRSTLELQNTAIFIGGSNIEEARGVCEAVLSAFTRDYRVSLMLDPSGANTTAAATVLKIQEKVDVADNKAVVLAGNGPVGQRIALLLAKKGCDVGITSRNISRAKSVAKSIKDSYNVAIGAHEVKDERDLKKVLNGVDIVVSTAPPEVTVLPKRVWEELPLKILADVNVIYPLGIEGIESTDDGEVVNEKITFGGMAIGKLKMDIHRECIKTLYQGNDLMLDIFGIYEVAEELA